MPGRVDRGAAFAFDGSYCACLLTALEPQSWGRIKAHYR
jgi:hypothetical protein